VCTCVCVFCFWFVFRIDKMSAGRNVLEVLGKETNEFETHNEVNGL